MEKLMYLPGYPLGDKVLRRPHPAPPLNGPVTSAGKLCTARQGIKLQRKALGTNRYYVDITTSLSFLLFW